MNNYHKPNIILILLVNNNYNKIKILKIQDQKLVISLIIQIIKCIMEIKIDIRIKIIKIKVLKTEININKIIIETINLINKNSLVQFYY